MKRYKVTHIMNKKQLGLILVAGLLSSTASARLYLVETNVDNVTVKAGTGTVILAAENKISSARAGTDVEDDAFNVSGEAGFIIPAGNTYYARIDLGGTARFGEAVAENAENTNFILGDAEVRDAAGGDNENFVILSLRVADDKIVPLGEAWTLDGQIYNLKSKGDVSITYRLYETAGAAVAGGSGELDEQSGTLITFKAATSMAGSASGSALIDVATKSTRFVGRTNTTHIMKVSVINNTAATPVQLPALNIADYAALTLNDVTDSITLTVTGDFSAVAENADGDEGLVWLDVDASCTPNIVSSEDDFDETNLEKNAGGHNLGKLDVNEDGIEAEVTIENDDLDDPFTGFKDAFLCMTVNGSTEILEGPYRGNLSMSAVAKFDAIAEVSFNGSVLRRNSESAVLNFLLTPDGVFDNYIRLTNTTSQPGRNLSITLYNDAGDSVTIDLGDIEGIDNSELAPRASTKLINIDVVYAAAQEEDSTFTVTGGKMGNKLRARIEGDILRGGLEAQALSVSTDNTTFFTF